MQIYLVRHGDAAVHPGESERRLTERGRENVRLIAKWLAGRGIAPREIRHSVKLRARETAEILAAALPDATVTEVQGLAPEDSILDAAEEVHRGRDDVMLVGHLPHLDRLASHLVSGGSEVAFDLPPATVLSLVRYRRGHPAVPSPARYAVRFLITPADAVT
jgi:phosphohistidine phosphatase